MTCGGEHAQCFPVTSSSGRGQVLAGQRLASGWDRVEVVGLGVFASGWPCWAVDLDDPLAMLQERGGQPGAVTAGALDRPHPLPVGLCIGEGDEMAVPERVGRDHEVINDGAGGRLDHRCRVRVAERVNADDVLDSACQHGFHGASSSGSALKGRHRPG